MAGANDELLVHRQSFLEFLTCQASKKNTKIISDAKLMEIKEFLLGRQQASKNEKRRIRRNGFLLKSFVDDPDVVCVLKEGRLCLYNLFYESYSYGSGVKCCVYSISDFAYQKTITSQNLVTETNFSKNCWSQYLNQF